MARSAYQELHRLVGLSIFLTVVIPYSVWASESRAGSCEEVFRSHPVSDSPLPTSPADQIFRDLIHRYGSPPAVYSGTRETYGMAPRDIPLYRGVTGPDHTINSVLELIRGDTRREPMSPTFRGLLNIEFGVAIDQTARETGLTGQALRDRAYRAAYEAARRKTAQEISRLISARGLKGFSARSTSGSSAGARPTDKYGEIVKFTNDLNSALNYAASNFRRNLVKGRRANPIVFDASGNGNMTLGLATPPPRGHYFEYDFLSNVSIRHINSVYVGLTRAESETAFDMPWIRIVPTSRRQDGSYETFTVEFVSVARKRDILEETGDYPLHELTNLEPMKSVGHFRRDRQMHLSQELNEAERASLTPFLEALRNLQQN